MSLDLHRVLGGPSHGLPPIGYPEARITWSFPEDGRRRMGKNLSRKGNEGRAALFATQNDATCESAMSLSNVRTTKLAQDHTWAALSQNGMRRAYVIYAQEK